MRRALGWALAAFAALASVGARDAGSAPRPFHLVGHWGQPTPDVRFLEKGGRAKWRNLPGFAIWNTAVAPGGKFALLRINYEPWMTAALVLALPEGRIVRAVPEPEGRMEAQWFALSSDGRWGLFAGENHDAVVWDTERPNNPIPPEYRKNQP